MAKKLIGVFILYLRDSLDSELVLADEYTSLKDLCECIWSLEYHRDGMLPIDEVQQLIFDLLENKYSRNKLWEVYYVRRSV